ncbi:hypothetical protein ABID42_003826, partial [Arcicella rosea]|uniref:hypothetical protein n=1 Tax=Arcicella rosea TaxID=502909 RepID=UPI00345DA44B
RKKEAKKEKYYSSNVFSVLRILIISKSKGWSYLQRNERKQVSKYEVRMKLLSWRVAYAHLVGDNSNKGLKS